MFHPHWRERALASLDETFDVVVIGGGITGCGVFLDASQRGLRTLLIEKQDLAAGTSSRSSKLIHGGLRYLKEFQLGVTRASSRERDRLAALNPGLVRPFRFVYPARYGDRTPGWTVDIGLWIYDRLTKRSRRHEHLTEDEVQQLLPGMDTDDLAEAFAFTDALTDDARLTIAVAATGFAYGGALLTRAEALEPLRDAAGACRGIRLRDLETGGVHEARGHVVVNATGVWADEVRARCGLGEARLRPSRGVHLVVSEERLPLHAAAMVPAPDDGRPVFLIPHEGGVLVGTTDVFHDGSLDDPRPTTAEVAYLLRTLQAHFPDRGLDDGDVVGVFAGLRPILAGDSDDPTEVSREEEIWDEGGLLHVAGGKLTTWRPTAEAVVDRVVGLLPEEVAPKAGRCYTKGTPLVGFTAVGLGERLIVAHGIEPAVAEGMALRLRAAALWTPHLARDAGELRPLVDGCDLCAAEVRHHLAYGAVLRLEDLLLRRARFGMWRPDLAQALLPALRPLFGDELGWDASHWERQVEAYAAAAEAWSPKGVVAG